MVRFIFDSNIVDNPSDWIELKSKLKRGETNNAVLLTIDGKFTFVNSAYAYLRDLYDNNVCAKVEASIQDQCGGDWIELVSGIIYISDCVFNENRCTVVAEIVDKSYFAKVNNNKSIEITLSSDRSKNGVAITAITPYLVDVDNISNPLVGVRDDIPCYRVYDAFRYCIDFMTDGTVGFASSIFEVGGEWEGLCLTSGQRLRTANSDIFPPFSFDKLYREINNRIPIVILVDNPCTNPTLRIEKTSYLNGATEVLSFTDLDTIISSTDTSKIYSAVELGCPTDSGNQVQLPDEIRFFCHRFEQFAFIGECNTDRVLDLSCEWISSTSAINASVSLGDQGYDTNVFVLDTTLASSTSGTLSQENYLGLTTVNKFWYNPRLTNSEILGRYYEDVPNSIASYLSAVGIGTFKAFNSAVATVVAPAVNPSFNFQTIAYNIGSYYNSFDTFVSGDLGAYTFEVFFDYTLVASPVSIIVSIDVYDTTPTVVGSTDIIPVTVLGASGTLSGTTELILPQGYSVKVRVTYSGSGTVDIGTDSYFTCTQNTVAGGIWQTNNPLTYSILNFNFECPLTGSEWQSIVNNQIGYITFSMNGQVPRRGYIQQAEYNHITGTAKINLTASKTQSNAS